MTIEKPLENSATNASGGKKLGVMRYVLGISIALATVAGIILWNIYATHQSESSRMSAIGAKRTLGGQTVNDRF
jgi:hypothetical protein